MCVPFYRSHPPLTPELQQKMLELKAIQVQLREKLIHRPVSQPIQTIAGCDSAFLGDSILSVFVVFSFPELVELEVVHSFSPVDFPYIPGFLSFREIPNLLLAYQKLARQPDIIMVDGQGVLHPRRMGIAAHLGVTLGRPTFGVAKKKLFGKYTEPAMTKGSLSPIFDQDEQLGVVLRSKENVKPLFISPGHLCSLEDALSLTLATLRKHKLPEPTRWADYYSKSLKSQYLPTSSV